MDEYLTFALDNPAALLVPAREFVAALALTRAAQRSLVLVA
jgi:hypothetical protein